VARSLGEVDPPNQDAYASNAARLVRDLEQLDAYAKQAISSIPKDRRVLITAHDAFNYLPGLRHEVRGIQGISTESEPGWPTSTARRLPGPTQNSGHFIESSVSDKNIQSPGRRAQARGHAVRIGGQLFSDAMGPLERTKARIRDDRPQVTTIVRRSAATHRHAPEGSLAVRP